MSFLIQFLQALFAWLAAFLVDLPLYILSLFLTGLATFINDIPAPGFFSSAAGYISSLPPLVSFLMSSFQIGAGITIIVTAFTIRFLIRRIPFIG